MCMHANKNNVRIAIEICKRGKICQTYPIQYFHGEHFDVPHIRSQMPCIHICMLYILYTIYIHGNVLWALVLFITIYFLLSLLSIIIITVLSKFYSKIGYNNYLFYIAHLCMYIYVMYLIIILYIYVIYLC